ncbi:MAG TPA: NAD(P)H-quinone oxidoreductase [Thermoanaerobaculia bacterium]|nr:NAD(P)H-quinone oxidoreductase [Thermoanaerobaculia bacterium]
MLAVAPFVGEAGVGSLPSLVELADPEPGVGEVLIDVRATALNRADLLQMRGLYPPPPGESSVPGLECAGVIVACGPETSRYQSGDRVMALLAGGGHASRVVAPEGQVMPVPESLTFEQAAGVPEVALTAWTNLVYEGRLERGQTVLITAAASGVGSFAVQVARELGATVIAAGRSRERLEALLELGADELVELGSGLAARVSDANGGRGVDLALDLVGGQVFADLLACVRDRGRIVLVGVLGGTQSTIDLGLVLRRRLRLVGSVLRSRSRAEKAGLVASFADFGLPRLADGRLLPVIDQVLPFARVAVAYRDLEQGGVFGKVVLRLQDDSS